MKKAVHTALLLFLLTFAASGQTSVSLSNLPGLEIVEKEWREINPNRNPELDVDPFKHINESNQLMRENEQSLSQEKSRAKLGLPPEQPPTRNFEPERKIGKFEPSIIYLYKLKLKNVGQKTVSSVTWEYVFIDPQTNAEVGRRQFKSSRKISPGETGKISMRSVAPPTETINAEQAGKKLREHFTELIVIQNVEFSDGTFWDVLQQQNQTSGKIIP